MGLFNSKRSEAITLVLIVVAILIFLGWLINFNSRECSSNSQCKEGFYCGSDFSCHQIPVIEKTIASYNLVLPSIILGIAIVIAAFVFKSSKHKKKNDEPKIPSQTTYGEHKQGPLRMP